MKRIVLVFIALWGTGAYACDITTAETLTPMTVSVSQSEAGEHGGDYRAAAYDELGNNLELAYGSKPPGSYYIQFTYSFVVWF